jgi:hypothetical protein
MSTQAQPSATVPEQPWHAAFPEPQASPKPMTRSEVLQVLKQGNEGAKLVLVDLRRTDYEVSPDAECFHTALKARILIILAGRYRKRLYQSTCSKSPPDYSLAL